MKSPQFDGRIVITSVDEIGIDKTADRIESASGTEATILFEPSARANEFKATPPEERVERVVNRDVDGPASRMPSIR